MTRGIPHRSGAKSPAELRQRTPLSPTGRRAVHGPPPALTDN
ncbi:hypothetical protein [Streptomyces alanosinicus]|nr:hypothetical protein [Streptomyces alanosinicus]